MGVQDSLKRFQSGIRAVRVLKYSPVVDVVSEARSINDGELDLEGLFL